MSLSTELVSQFVKITRDEKQTGKETTLYGTAVEHGGSIYVRLDGSDQLTPISTTADIKAGERVTVLIKNHTATVTGNVSSPATRIDDTREIGNKIDDFEIVVADKVSTQVFDAEIARIEKLVAGDVNIEGRLTANEADIKDLQADNLTVKERLEAAEADIGVLTTDKLDANIADIKYATVENLNATNADVHNLTATYGEFSKLTADKLAATDASITNLQTKKLDADTASITYAKIADLDATNADITNLEADVADIDTLIFGSASGNTIHSSFANAVIAQLGDAQIKSAMIDSVSADKIVAGDISTNTVRVVSDDGKLLISDETVQISDGTRVRVQIGKDAVNDYSINIWDAAGNLMFSQGGITDSAIKEAIIRNDMISDTANIAAHKLDIDSLFEEINGSSKTIKSTRVYLDEEAQTLDIAFKEMSTDLSGVSTKVDSQGSQIEVLQDKIATKVWQQDIDTATNSMSTQYSTLEQEVDGIAATVENHSSKIDSKADSTTVTTVSNKVANLETNLSGFKSTVSNTYATKNEVSDIEVGGRNLLLNSKSFSGANISAGTASIVEETYKDFSVRHKDHSAVTDRYSDMVTYIGIYADKLGEEYTLSYYAKGTGSISTYFYGPTNYIRIAKVVKSDGSVSTSPDGSSTFALTENWTRYWVTWTLASEGDITIPKWVLFRISAGGVASVCGAKLEKGNRATDWTPAPEDVNLEIAAVQAAAEAAQATANQNAVDMANIVTGINGDIANLQTQIDGSITTWFYEVEPTNSNAPAVNWTTTDLKNVHLGDLYYDTITGYCYRYQVQNNVYSWQRITDTDVTKALSDAQAAQDTADQKRRVFYTQPAPPYDTGDLWVQGSNGDILRCQTAKISGQTYSASDWIAASKYTDDTLANSANEKANSAQQAAAAAQNDIDNLVIGGRNILPNSRGDNATGWVYAGIGVVEDDEKGHCVEVRNTSNKEQYIGSARTSIVEPSTEYTFSADLWCNEYLTNYDLFWLSDTIDDPKTAGGYVNVTVKSIQKLTPNKWTHVEWTFTTPDDDYTGYIRIDANATTEEGTAAIMRAANLKLEKGNRATDWTPAPEDLEDRVEKAETKILQNSDSITALATRTTTVENKFAGYSTTEQMNSAITQSANSITSSVSQTYTTKTEFADLDIGGRNLVAGTDDVTVYSGNKTDGNGTYMDVWSAKTIDIPTATEYIISFDAKADVDQTIRCHFYNPNTTLTSLSSTGQYRASAGDGTADVTITTEWARYWVKWTQTPADTKKSIIVGRNMTENDIHIRAVKFEVGNKATAWTPAPEDMATGKELTSVENSLETTRERMTETESIIQQLSESIMTLVTDGNGESLMVQTETGWTFSTAQIQSIVDNTAQNLSDLTDEMGDVNTTVNTLSQAVADLGILNDYVKIGTYENEPCIELGENDSDFKLMITNTRIMFMEGSGIPAYITNQSLHIKKAVIEEELQQGEFVWQARANGNLGLIWKGVNS